MIAPPQRAGAQGCRQPDSANGECAQPLRCPCRGVRLIRALADLILRYQRGRLIVAERLGVTPDDVDALADLDAEVRSQRTPERAAEAEGARDVM